MKSAIDQTAPPPRRAVIFESYGWGDAENIAKRIKTSLEQAGYDVWIDKEHIRPDDDHFSSLLEGALKKCQVVVALHSPHSVRLEGDIATASRLSVCHNELILAVKKNMPVVSVIVVECDQPFAINHYEPIDFTDWQSSPEAYQKGIREILQWIGEGLADPPRRRYHINVDNLPGARLSFPEELTAEGSFVGRGWLTDRLTAWLDGDQRCFMIEAEPGAGKTALVAELVRRNPGGRILACHFCNAQREDTIDARRFVRSLAATLCGTVPEYRQRLRRSEDVVRALQTSNPASTMLWQGVLAPLHEIAADGAHCVIVDALDEAAGSPDISIPQLLAEALADFPLWFRLVVTTRRDERVVPLFQEAERCFLGEALVAQQDDLRQYIEERLADPQLHVIGECDEEERRRATAIIAERSAGNFQYAATVFDALRSREFSLGEIDQLPTRLVALYYRLANKRFPTRPDFAPARIVLAVVLAARQPLTRPQIARIAGLDQDDTLSSMLDTLNCFVTWDSGATDERVYRLTHKSVGDWLVSPPGDADRFKIDPAAGRELILRHCRGWAGHREPYALTYLIAHLLEAGLTGEALAAVRDGLFGARRGQVDPGQDLDDTRELTLALLRARDQPAILELAKTDNIWQRDGVVAALQMAEADDNDFVDRVAGALLEVRS
jgi:hypothetical protein